LPSPFRLEFFDDDQREGFEEFVERVRAADVVDMSVRRARGRDGEERTDKHKRSQAEQVGDVDAVRASTQIGRATPLLSFSFLVGPASAVCLGVWLALDPSSISFSVFQSRSFSFSSLVRLDDRLVRDRLEAQDAAHTVPPWGRGASLKMRDRDRSTSTTRAGRRPPSEQDEGAHNRRASLGVERVESRENATIPRGWLGRAIVSVWLARERVEGHAERTCDSNDGGERRFVAASLKATDRLDAEIRAFSERDLRQPGLLSHPTNIPPDRPLEVHSRSGTRVGIAPEGRERL